MITSKAANGSSHSRDQFVLPCCLLWRQVSLDAPAARTAFEHVSVVQQAVEQALTADAGYRGWLPTEDPEEFNSLAARSSDRLNCAGYILNAHTGARSYIFSCPWYEGTRSVEPTSVL